MTLDVSDFGVILHGRDVMQYPHDLEAWLEFLAGHEVSAIVELGTCTGGMSLWLADHAGCRVLTFDRYEPEPFPDDRVVFEQLDVFNDGLVVAARMRGLPRPLLLYCDNGDKPREVLAFTPLLRPGDFLAVHDFGQEIHASDIPSMLADVSGPAAGRSLTRFYRRA